MIYFMLEILWLSQLVVFLNSSVIYQNVEIPVVDLGLVYQMMQVGRVRQISWNVFKTLGYGNFLKGVDITSGNDDLVA